MYNIFISSFIYVYHNLLKKYEHSYRHTTFENAIFRHFHDSFPNHIIIIIYYDWIQYIMSYVAHVEFKK